MYASFLNHIYHLLHYGFSFWVIGVLAPSLIFPSQFERRVEQTVSNFIRAVFIIIILGYALVITKLFEVLSLLFIYTVVMVVLFLPQLKAMDGKYSIFKWTLRFFDVLDGLFSIHKKIKKMASGEVRTAVKEKAKTYASAGRLPKVLIVLFVFGYSLFIRFYDALIHAAPPLSDSYVTLAWMKYINGRILFHDGIYPQGFHIYLATLLKFAAIDPMYILKYTGPLNTFFIVLGFYFFAARLTGSFLAGITAAMAYGLWGEWLLLGAVERQIGTNSQEFAFVFLFPVLYFYVLYMLKRQKAALVTAFMGTAVTGLVHSLAFAYLGISIGLLLIAGLFVQGKNGWPQIVPVVRYALLSVVISIMPLGIGYLLGKNVHSSSANYLIETIQTDIGFAQLHAIDYVTLSFFPFLLLVSISGRRTIKERLVSLFSLLLGISVFFLYFAGGNITKSVLISARSVDLWAITIPVCLGVGVFAVCRCAPAVFAKRHMQGVILCGLILFTAVELKPSPIYAYKMERDASVEQYLRIRDAYLPKTWMIVSQDEGYSTVLGNGIHMYMEDFLNVYDPAKPPLTKKGERKPDQNIPPDIFVFHEKTVFRVSETNSIYSLLEPKYEQRETDNRNLRKWLDTYMSHHYKVKVYYEDSNFIVYHFHIVQPKKKGIKHLWRDA
ncbi:glycosyltransferase family protein [Priestia abyssalis]|uniref:hypothetical protein n=1 Tax=Priestia abyssalis TaxID=1221450 RepID=UPI000994B646|nr:hypothetical protein [Priestia abyssalis]